MMGYNLIVVGDKKTPEDWHWEKVDYFSVFNQKDSGFKLTNVLPYNHYSRKMFGYLKAIECGAEYIIDTDDDNIPKEDYGFPKLDKEYDCIYDSKGFINIYQLYTKEKIWPRGLPLNSLNSKFDFNHNMEKKNCNVGIWQGLADEDPDVDAIYRLTNDSSLQIIFERREPVVLGKGTISPFNSQNTLIRKELFSLLYLPTSVTFRFTDILRGLVAQPIMWLYDYLLGFTNATVIQKRNPHNYMNDFISEIPMYQHIEQVVELVSNSISRDKSIEDNLYNAYGALLKQNIVNDNEMKTLDAWLQDITTRR
jgi:hypothetical protein